MNEVPVSIAHNARTNQYVCKSETATHVHLEGPMGQKMILHKGDFGFIKTGHTVINTVVITSVQPPEEPAIVMPDRKIILPN